MIISIIIFFIIFGVLVISHEGGHFLIAKANGIRVNEFSVGMGPELFKKQKGETLYTIRLLPIGGACIFDGMDGLQEEKGTQDEHSFQKAKVWSRIATVLAGPFFNFLTAYLMALVVTGFSVWNFPVVSEVMDQSAAQEAGLQQGDTILSMNGEKIHMAQEATLISQLNSDGNVFDIVYQRGESQYETKLTPKYSDKDKRYYMGVYIGQAGKVTGAKIIPYAGYTVEYYLKATYKSLIMLVEGKLGKDSVSGPVGMVKMVDDTYEEAKPYGLPSVVLTMLDLALLLSVNLGVMNLLPIPALDGGRLVFLLLEVIRGKPVPPEKEGLVHLAGMVALMVLMVFVMFNDITKFLK